MQPLRSEAIATFLKAKTHEDLSSLYNINMEVQVNVAKDNGEMFQAGEFRGREWTAWTDGMETWKSFRIPYNANSEPSYTDKPMSFSLENHCEGIGMTGWDWQNRLSRWIAYDFDAITGHSDRHSRKLTDDQLKQVREAVEKIPFATLRLSTSGKGLHLYVFLEPVPTSNHNEHAALARAILSMMSGLAAFDFTSSLDICGSNMWVWHRKMTGTNGLTVLKQGEILQDVPANWREHINVVARKSKRVVPQFVAENPSTAAENDFMELCGQRNKVPLDNEHQRLIAYLQTNNCMWWWDNDNWLLGTHTIHLKEAHRELCLKGKYDTVSTGVERGHDYNCYAFPLRDGAWTIRRYSQGTKEHESWSQDGKNYTRCFFNREPDITTVARVHQGVEHEKGGWIFRDAESAMKALLEVGVDINPLPPWIMNRKTHVKSLRTEGKIIISMDAEPGKDDAAKLAGWYLDKKQWKRVFRANLTNPNDIDSKEDYDDLIRHIVSEQGEDAGWVINRGGAWCEEPLTHVRVFLNHLGSDGKEIGQILGRAVEGAWKIVNKPFQPEYPGDREWNRNAAQFTVPPSTNIDSLSYPTYQKILNHTGQSLDSAIQKNTWCKTNGISSGADYLKLWLTCVVKRPDQPTPYLAFYGDQDCGKSTFHEMLNFIITCGLVGGDMALTNSQGFNGELENALFCYVEETDLGNTKINKIAYNRIKDWVTSPYLTIHPKHGTPYRIKNTTHWIHCANDPDAFPLFPGDTRITLCYVPPLPKDQLIGKRDLETLLRKEAPDFLAALLATEIPQISDRLMLPIIEIQQKKDAAKKNQTALETFIEEECHFVPGAYVTVVEFFEKFQLSLDESERAFWSKNRIGRDLPSKFPKGRLTGNPAQCYGNMSFNPDTAPTHEFRSDGIFLRPK